MGKVLKKVMEWLSRYGGKGLPARGNNEADMLRSPS